MPAAHMVRSESRHGGRPEAVRWESRVRADGGVGVEVGKPPLLSSSIIARG